MSARSSEEALPYKGLTQEELNILFRPISCWQGLQKHHDLLHDTLVPIACKFM